MKIGIAITTTPKRFDPERNYFENCPEGTVCYLHNDVKGLGGPSSKNECIKKLYEDGCDYLFLLDDDTKILNPYFVNWMIGVSVDTGIQHLTFPGGPAIVARKEYANCEIAQYVRGAGVMLFCTRAVIDKVGYLNVNYPGKWGHSHIGWSIRILKAGFIPGFKGWRVSPVGIEKYFWSDDLNGTPAPENYSRAEKDRYMKLNQAEHNRENTSKQIYYPYQTRQEAVPA